jgi:CRISPR system Cascade subunit CasB
VSDYTDSFIAHLQSLAAHDRGSLAALRRSLGFAPGTYPPAYPSVERFAAQGGDKDSLRQALYLSAGLFALHPQHVKGRGIADAFGQVMQRRASPSIEKRFIALLSAEADSLPDHLRQVVALLAADGIGLDYGALLSDIEPWLHPRAFDTRDRVRQRWARAFYRATVPQPPATDAQASQN